ncbi:glucan endo-1,3-beta-glucosidase 13-like [Chenopodium quinoa]|uniref:glucan endo-1,3-beta-glucosidase 13-like n=1 Tax=Chenopodium quinoa TaxID=63459 RepID=UPI000B792C37|nr:glucan endo-1,3-beta-glucosidase 13-like [Chenopodium quinoa]
MAFFPLKFSLLFLLTTITSFSLTTSTPTIGVTIQHHPFSATPEHISAAVNRNRIAAVRLIDPDPNLIRAFSYSSVSLLLCIPNTLVHSLAANRSNAAVWLYTHVVPFYPRANISAISVGSDILSSSDDLADALLPAIRNIHVALHELGIRRISVSSTFSLIPLITSAFPPSSAEFSEPLNEHLIRPLLDFLEEANSSFLVNIHPYDFYRLNHEVVLGYALFQKSRYSFVDDPTTGVRYQNLFDTLVDAVLSAMAVAGHENIPVVVTETGWPNAPAISEENNANQVFAEMYLRGLLKHLKSGVGTPLKKEGVSGVYIYELFDKERDQGNSNASFRQWGIFYPNLTSKYDLDYSRSYRNAESNGFWKILAVSLVVLALL